MDIHHIYSTFSSTFDGHLCGKWYAATENNLLFLLPGLSRPTLYVNLDELMTSTMLNAAQLTS